MADETALARLWGAIRTRRRERSAEDLAALEMPITDVVASQAVFGVVEQRLRDRADAGQKPTQHERLAHIKAAGEVALAVDRLALAYEKATGQGGTA